MRLILVCIISFLRLIPLSCSEPIPINVNRPSAGSPTDIRPSSDEAILPAEGILRNALKRNSWNRWKNRRIPFVIADGQFSPDAIKLIRQTMHIIARNTCVKFRKRRNEHAYVEIKNERGQGCYATVGQQNGKSVLMLESSSMATCITHETIIHEMFHVIGLWHEQMRADRDRYVKIHYENIPSSTTFNFNKMSSREVTTYGVKYDYRSVMHYTKDAFASSPGQITIETKNRKYQDIIGNVKKASRGDYKKICSIYSCAKCMGKPFKRKGKSKSRGKSKRFKNKRGRRRRS